MLPILHIHFLTPQIYNLVWTGGPAATPHAPDDSAAAGKLLKGVRQWVGLGGAAQGTLVLPLEHSYTMTNLAFNNLKVGPGQDACLFVNSQHTCTGLGVYGLKP